MLSRGDALTSNKPPLQRSLGKGSRYVMAQDQVLDEQMKRPLALLQPGTPVGELSATL